MVGRGFNLLWFLAVVGVAQASTYVPPVGIPSPSFGIDETHYIYQDKIFKAGGFKYKDAGFGPYSHYVDNSVECADFVNPYGDQVKPRCTVPEDLASGSVVELHGGPYQSLRVHEVHGSREQPIFIRGYRVDDRPSFMAAPGMKVYDSSYVIIENIITDGSSLSRKKPTVALSISQPANYISVRASESKNYPMPELCPKRKGGVGCWFGTVWSVGANKRWRSTEAITNIVLYNNHIHHNGDYFPKYESGRHAINVSGGTKNIWILDNRLEYNAEDGVQIYWKKGGSRGQPAEKVYIGRNVIANNGENAIDIKQSFDVIVSENEIYGYRRTNFPASGSDGAAIVLNDDAPNDRLWVINNRIYDSAKGVRSQTKGSAYIVGNLFYNIIGSKRPSSPGKANGVGIWSSSAANFYAVQNTLYDVSGGIYANNGKALYIKNNIISNLGESNGIRGYHMAINHKNFSVLEIDHNLLYQPNDKVSMRGTRCDRSCVMGDSPLFSSVGNKNFSLMPDSSAIDRGAEGDALKGGDVYAIFSSLYSLDIKKDILGTARPQGRGMDVGAYEVGE